MMRREAEYEKRLQNQWLSEKGEMTEYIPESRRACYTDEWDFPTLEQIRAAKRSPRWNSFSERRKELFNALEWNITHPQDRGADGEPIFDHIVVPVKNRQVFG